MDVAAFLRTYQMRAGNIMWFLGAGASRAAGIKTAGDMIWDFKQNLYRSHKKLPPNAITDPGDPAVQRKLQRYFDELPGFPAGGGADEYARHCHVNGAGCQMSAALGWIDAPNLVQASPLSA